MRRSSRRGNVVGDLPDQVTPPHVERPYRVGMARSSQRYIEPDEIYQDLQRGGPTAMPRAFPWTWNPVNGLGSVALPMAPSRQLSSAAVGDIFSDTFSDLTNLIKGGVEDVTGAAGDAASGKVEEFLKTGPGKEFFAKIEDAAAVGVTKVVKEQGVNLIMLAVAGGAVGGALSAKLGKAGTILSLVVAAWAASRIMGAVAPPPVAKPKPKGR